MLYETQQDKGSGAMPRSWGIQPVGALRAYAFPLPFDDASAGAPKACSALEIELGAGWHMWAGVDEKTIV